MTQRSSSFSITWIVVSYLLYVALEIVLSGLVGRLVFGRFIGQIALIRLETLLILASYFSGGFLVGVISPHRRMIEPAAGAFLAVITTFLYTVFTPFRFYGFLGQRIVIGGLLAFAIALAGAYVGERLTGNA